MSPSSAVQRYETVITTCSDKERAKQLLNQRLMLVTDKDAAMKVGKEFSACRLLLNFELSSTQLHFSGGFPRHRIISGEDAD